MENVKIVVLMNNQVLISQVEEVGADIGEPDCKLIEPFIVDNKTETLTPWLVEYSSKNTFMISSDKILTITDPRPTLLEKFQSLIK
jgi:hypothetical protein